MTKTVTISCDKISSKQWSVLLIELNLMKDSWKPYARLDIQAPEFEKVVLWGKRKHNEKDKDEA